MPRSSRRRAAAWPLLVAIAMAISLLLMLLMPRRLSRPGLSVPCRLGGSHDYVKLALYPAARAQPDLLIMRLDEPLFFVDAERSLHLARGQQARYLPAWTGIVPAA